MIVNLDVPVRRWHCPSCDTRDETRQPGPHTQFHNCPALNGLGVPLIEVRSHSAVADARLAPNLSDDDGSLSSISTLHGSGRVDCTVFPRPARLILRSQ